MKKRLKSLTAILVAAALILSVNRIPVFAAESEFTLKDGVLYTADGKAFEGTLKEGDKITGADPDSLFYVTVNGEKDAVSSQYSSQSFDGYTQANTESEKSGNKYYTSYTVASAPEGFEAEASVKITESEDYTGTDASSKGKVIALTYNAVTSGKEFTVTYYSNGKIYKEAQSYKAGDKIILPEAPVAPEGYIFNGWVINEKQDALPEIMPENNLEASASWKLADINITFISDETEYHKATLPYGSSMEKAVPADPVKDGYTFAGWYDSEGKNVFDYQTIPSKDTEFTAKWLKKGNVVYMISKDKSYAAYEVTEGEKIPVPDTEPEKFGYKFKGWTPEIPDKMPSEDLVFTAEFEIDEDFITITIGGTLITGTIIGAIGAAITGVSIVGSIISVIGLSSVIGNVNKSYTVTYKSDGKVYKTYKVSAGSKITVPEAPAKEGYVFSKWTPEIPDKMPKKDLTFEAVWAKKESNIPATGSAETGIASFIMLAVSGAAAIILLKKKKSEI